MQIQRNISLQPYNTFGIDEPAEFFISLGNTDAITEISLLPQRKHVLGGGSNILLTGPVKGIVIRNELKGVTAVKEDDEYVWLQVAAGENWHNFVMYAINKDLGGIENLALIPGTVGASPMQNIGAYGVEARETIESVTCWLWNEQTFVTFKNNECSFGYRDSIFKQQLRDKAFITSVVYRLNKRHTYHTGYGAITQELEHMGVQELSIKAIAQAVINIRTSKLPDPKVIGNAGSFFKNPTITSEHFQQLQKAHPTIPSYPANDGNVKIPAGWLIEQCGWKGYRHGDTGVHAKQALVLVNYGHAHGSEIWKLSGDILKSVHEEFGITLEREVQVW